MKKVTVGFQRQRGAGYISTATIIFVFIVFLTAAVKVVPVYLENLTIRSVLEAVAEDFSIEQRKLGKQEVREVISKRFSMNQIDHISAKDINLTRKNSMLVINANYEHRVAFMANIDFMIKFENNIFNIDPSKHSL